MLGGADVSFTIEQRFPLSPLRTHRRQAAEADVERARAEIGRVTLDVELEAMRRMVEGQAAVALSQVDAARERHLAMRDNVLPRARFAIDPALASYAAGQLPLVSVLEAVQALRAAQSELIESEVALGLAWARLGRAAGTYEARVP